MQKELGKIKFENVGIDRSKLKYESGAEDDETIFGNVLVCSSEEDAWASFGFPSPSTP